MVCEECGRAGELRETAGDGMLCGECLRGEYTPCQACRLWWPTIATAADASGRVLCPECSADLSECGWCGLWTPNETTWEPALPGAEDALVCPACARHVRELAQRIQTERKRFQVVIR